jgi:Response regulator containing CheY-like receiver domain and AraC-type DNA-binding domain
MNQLQLSNSIKQLQAQFSTLNWCYDDIPSGNTSEKMYHWPGKPEEDIIITVHNSTGTRELFHRHDFFFFNYTYAGEYNSLSYKYNNSIVIKEHELYAGQPFAGHALFAHDNYETIIIGVLIQKETFFHYFLPFLSANTTLLHFFLDPSTNIYSQEFIHFKIENSCGIQLLLEMMIVEYANKQFDTQDILKPLTLSFLTQVARQYTIVSKNPEEKKLSDQILMYIHEHFNHVSLKEIGNYFSYHPNYISTLLTKETGKSFSQIILEQRMERAIILLKDTTLSISEIGSLLGYSNSSNFHKAFRKYYKMSPRTYIQS